MLKKFNLLKSGFSIYPFWSGKLEERYCFWSFKRKEINWTYENAALKRLFHLAKCTDYVMMVTAWAHSPYGWNMRPTTPVFKWSVQF